MSEPCKHDYIWANRDTDDDYELRVCRLCGHVDIDARIPDEPDSYWDEPQVEFDSYGHCPQCNERNGMYRGRCPHCGYREYDPDSELHREQPDYDVDE